MLEVVQDSIRADSVVVDTIQSVVELPARDSLLVQDITHIFGTAVSKGNGVLEVTTEMAHTLLSWSNAAGLLLLICLYIIIIRVYPREIAAVAKIIFYPTLFNKTHELNSVHLKHYMAVVFVLSGVVITLLSWLYLAHGDFRVPIAVYLYLALRTGIPYLVAVRKGRKSPLSKSVYFLISFYTTSFCVLTPVAVATMIFGASTFFYTLIIIVLSSYYLFAGRFFYTEKFSFKQLLLYLCTAEAIPLALVSCLFYTKIITFGN